MPRQVSCSQLALSSYSRIGPSVRAKRTASLLCGLPFGSQRRIHMLQLLPYPFRTRYVKDALKNYFFAFLQLVYSFNE